MLCLWSYCLKNDWYFWHKQGEKMFRHLIRKHPVLSPRLVKSTLFLSPTQLEIFPTFGRKISGFVATNEAGNFLKSQTWMIIELNQHGPETKVVHHFLLKKKEQGRRSVTVFIQYKTHICHVSIHNHLLSVFYPVLFFSLCSWGKCNPRRQPFKSHKSPFLVGKCLQMKLLYTN